MNVVAFVDLDDTLFQTRAKCPPGEHRQVSTDATGAAGSFMSRKQERFLSALLGGATIVPTTGRSLAGFARVDLRWADHAILNHGATILGPGGVVDEAWLARTRAVSGAHHPRLEEARAALAAAGGDRPGLRFTVHEEHDLPLYALAKADRPDHDALADLREAALVAADRLDLHAFAAGRAVTLIPRDLSKVAAVREVRDRLAGDEDVLTLGVGDALSDTGFMAECDYAVTPRGSQILRVLAGGHHVHG